jgi:hypothetical protein
VDSDEGGRFNDVPPNEPGAMLGIPTTVIVPADAVCMLLCSCTICEGRYVCVCVKEREMGVQSGVVGV